MTSLSYRTILTAKESEAEVADDVSQPATIITHDQFNTTINLSDTTQPPVSKISSQILQLSSGGAVLDLTNLPGLNGTTLDGTGLKIRAVKFKGMVGMQPFTIAHFGFGQAYDIFGANFSVVVNADQEVVFYGGDTSPVIDGTHKNISVSGTGSDTIQVEIILG